MDDKKPVILPSEIYDGYQLFLIRLFKKEDAMITLRIEDREDLCKKIKGGDFLIPISPSKKAAVVCAITQSLMGKEIDILFRLYGLGTCSCTKAQTIMEIAEHYSLPCDEITRIVGETFRKMRDLLKERELNLEPPLNAREASERI